MFENIANFFRKLMKSEKKESGSKDAAKERLHLVLMQDRANVSADFLELMKQEIIEVIKKYIEVDEKEIDVRLTNKENEDGTNGAPALYANIPILNIKNEMKKEVMAEKREEKIEEKSEEHAEVENQSTDDVKKKSNDNTEESQDVVEESASHIEDVNENNSDTEQTSETENSVEVNVNHTEETTENIEETNIESNNTQPETEQQSEEKTEEVVVNQVNNI